LVGIAPLVMAIQLVIFTAPPAGITKSWQNTGVWVNVAAVVETDAARIETAVAALS
jgi:hypothetical protein